MKFLVTAFFLLLVVTNAKPNFNNLTTSRNIYRGIQACFFVGKIDGENHVVKDSAAVGNVSLTTQVVR